MEKILIKETETYSVYETKESFIAEKKKSYKQINESMPKVNEKFTDDYLRKLFCSYYN